jgi:hypothetical protein
MQSNVSEERMDRGEAYVATAGAVVTLFLQVVEEFSE